MDTKEQETKFVLLNSFDRTGSSAISRTLAHHTDIELIFQPFNSGSIRHKMYQILNEENASEADYSFFKQLINNYLDESYIQSDWHEKYSSTRTIQDGKLHLIKTTLNHFTAEWMLQNFPSVSLWGIWRKPMDILCSIVRNDVFEKWYSDAKKQIIPTVVNTPILRDQFVQYIPQLNRPAKIMAFLIAVRSYYFFYHLPQGQIILYDDFSKRPNGTLNHFLDKQDLQSFDFNDFASTDWNVSGKAFQLGAIYTA